jgi:hypothetical protein
MKTTLLDKSLRRLAHPATITALGLLLVNDHLLRRLWPSWLTGKLGDVAWLFVAPLALAVIISALAGRLPLSRSARERLVLVAAWGSVGAVFVLAKTVPATHTWVVAAAGRVFGFPVGWRLDPTDLLALPALLLSGWWWLQSEAGLAPVPRRGWVLLPLAALLTMANSPAPDPGIYCLTAQDGRLHAFAGYAAYTTTDGGLSWQADTALGRDDSCREPWSSEVAIGSTEPVLLSDPARPDTVYRYGRGQAIEISADGGATWQMGYELRPATEAEVALTQRSLKGNLSWYDGPLDAAVDPATGNAVFAMGNLGVLVHGADGPWTWVEVGSYHQVLMRPGDVVSLLSAQLILALALVVITLGTLAMRLGQGGPLPILMIFAWMLWPLCVFLFSPEIAYGYGLLFVWLGVGGLLLLLIPSTILSILRLARTPRPVVQRVVMVAVTAGLLFLLPFLLWAMNAIPLYWWAAGFAVVLGSVTLVAGARWARG